MKVRLVEGLQLIITPENYVEHVALAKWAETHQSAGGLLVEAYAEHRVQADPPSALKNYIAGIRNDDGTISFPAESAGS